MTRTRRTTAPVDFSDSQAAQTWFERQPRAVCIVVAMRAALRVLPLLTAARDTEDFLSRIMLPVCRAGHLSWTAAKNPLQSRGWRAAANASGRATIDAYADKVTDVVNAVAAAAYTVATVGDAAYATLFSAEAARATEAADEVVDAMRADVAAIEAGRNVKARTALAVELAGVSLWQEKSPDVIALAWAQLQATLLAGGDDWDVWGRWYGDRLAGRPSLGNAFDIAVATLPSSLWEQGPAAVNARIKELIAKHAPSEPIPGQGPGPHFGLDADIQIARVASPEIDATGNNEPRINELLPLLRRAADRLVAALGSTNAFQALAEDARDYRQSIDGEARDIAWGTVFGLGVMLESTGVAAERELPDRMRPNLEDDAKAALDAVRTLHAALILESRAGRDLIEQAERVALSPAQQATLRAYAQEIANALAQEPEIIKPEAADLNAKASAIIGAEPHAEQGTVFGLATVGHLATILVPAAVVGEFALQAGGLIQAALPLAGSVVLRESQRVKTAAQALAGGYDRLVDTAIDQAGLVRAQAVERLRLLAPFREFVARHQHPLLQIAENSTNLRWMRSYIQFITRSSPD